MSLARKLSTASVYIHWPYCKRKCTYCNFNKYVSKFVDHVRMRKCLLTELDTLLQMGGIRNVSSIFFGGGTPSLAEPATLEAVITLTQQKASMATNAEISIEVNPTSPEAKHLKDFSIAGINRVSIGLQTLHDCGLKVLGRDHSVQDGLRCLEAAKKIFPSQVSVDLMFGWPGQTLEMWQKELSEILPLCDNHISLYQLTLERGTQLFKFVKSNRLRLPDDQTMEEMYLQAIQILSDAGFERYEVSNFARQGQYSQHNKSYWTGEQYIGVGPGAHGRFQPKDKDLREARIQTLDPSSWMFEVENYGHATRKSTPLSILQQLEELLIVGLRTKQGVPHKTWQSVSCDTSMNDVFADSAAVNTFIHGALLKFDNRGLRATPEGLNILDSLLPDLLNVLHDTPSFTTNSVTCGAT